MTIFNTKPVIGYTDKAYPRPQIDTHELIEESKLFWDVIIEDYENWYCIHTIMKELELPITKKRVF